MSHFSIIELWSKHLPLRLSPLWQVLYYEGMHGNHILFSPADVAEFENSTLPAALAYPIEKKTTAELYLRLIKAASYQDLTQWIDSLTKADRQLVYRLYQQWLQAVRARLIAGAH